jgi:hypothetical protein
MKIRNSKDLYDFISSNPSKIYIDDELSYQKLGKHWMDLINNEVIDSFEMVIIISESLFKYNLKIKGE